MRAMERTRLLLLAAVAGSALLLAPLACVTDDPALTTAQVDPLAGRPEGPLEEGVIGALFARLPPLPRLASAELPRPAEGAPPPPPARTSSAAFSASQGAAPVVAARPLQVLRIVPEGDVDVAGAVLVSFSEPMVPLASLGALAATPPPVQLSPPVALEARWLDPRTVELKGTPRLPMATELTVTVPKGTRSAAGAELTREVKVVLRTPPPRVLERTPNGPGTALLPVIALAFDQRVDPAALLPYASLAAGAKRFPLRLATKQELAADPNAASLASRFEAARIAAFVPTQPLPKATTLQLSIGAGAPSAEGARRVSAALRHAFTTYGPLKLTGQRCDGEQDACEAGGELRLVFSNPLDEAKGRAGGVTISPAVEELKIDWWGDDLRLTGKFRRRTAYTVSAEGLVDVYGQPLAGRARVTFRTAPAGRLLEVPGGELVLLDASARPALPLFTVNEPGVALTVRSVAPAQHRAFLEFLRGREDHPTPPGRIVEERVLRPQGPADTIVESAIELGRALEQGTGHAIVSLRPQPRDPEDPERETHLWVQVTRLGVQARFDRDALRLSVTELADGRVAPGVEVSLDGARAVTDAEGVARLPLPTTDGSAPRTILLARAGDRPFVPESIAWLGSSSSWRVDPPGGHHRFLLFDDRGLYRPGETARVKGLVRWIAEGPRGDVEPARAREAELTFRLQDARGRKLQEGVTRLSETGAFELTIPIAADAAPGTAWLRLSRKVAGVEESHSHPLEVQEFRRPEFEVALAVDPGPHFGGGKVPAEISARYFAGGPLAGAQGTLVATTRSASHVPPGHPGFVFGQNRPWWLYGGGKRGWDPDWEGGSVAPAHSSAVTLDAAGRRRVTLELPKLTLAALFQLEASVEDVNRQSFSSRAAVLLHPAKVYAGLRSERTFVGPGEPIRVEGLAVTPEGGIVPGRTITLTATRRSWQGDGEPRTCTIVTAEAPVVCELATDGRGGRHELRALVTDEEGRTSETTLTVYEAGEPTPPQRTLQEEPLTLLPEREAYEPGQTAKVLVPLPFSPAEATIAFERDGVLHEERRRWEGSYGTVEVPLTDAHVPNVWLSVELVGSKAREPLPGAPKGTRPAFAAGRVKLVVAPTLRALTVEVAPAQRELEPGGRTDVKLVVKDAAGAGVAGAELTVIAVDEAVLAMAGARGGIPEPLRHFLPERAGGVRSLQSRAWVVLPGAPPPTSAPPPPPRVARPGGAKKMKMAEMAESVAAPAPAAESGASDGASESGAIRVREDLDPLALFLGAVRTDARGEATVALPLPDSLTRYRVLAVATEGARRFGTGASNVTARLPLMVRPSPPRHLRFGDTAELPVVVQNGTSEERLVDVALRASGVTLTGAPGVRVRLGPNERRELRFPIQARVAGLASLQAVAVSGAAADAQSFTIPVRPPASGEAFALYGVLEEGAISLPLQRPEGALPGFGGLEVTTSSTELGGLTDAVLWLHDYPYGCTEQLASRVLAIAALADVLAAFRVEGLPPPAELRAAAQRDLDELTRRQSWNGAFGLWARDGFELPWASVHAAHAIARAKAAGLKVDDEVLDRTRRGLRELPGRIPKGYDAGTRATVKAYALAVRARLGDADPAAGAALVDEAGERLSVEAAGLLHPMLAASRGHAAVAAELRRRAQNRVSESAEAAHVASRIEDGAHLVMHADKVADALWLEALVTSDATSELVPKLVRGLLGARRQGRWSTTQENVFALLALQAYFRRFEAVDPDFTARAWVGDAFAGAAEFHGRSGGSVRLGLGLDALPASAPLVLQKDGTGRLSYRLGLRYAPVSNALPALDRGFVVERRYEGVDDPKDVSTDEAGAVTVRAGARVRVVLTLVAPTLRHHVALVDPMPAGLEPENPELATTRAGETQPWDWRWPWWEHEALRDDRAELFRTELHAGVYRYAYLARATTPGAYEVPPARAEEMYAPESFGRTASAKLYVK